MLCTTGLLAERLTNFGLLQEAEAILVRAHEVAARVHGANAEIVHAVRMPLASLLGTMRKFSEAIKLFREELAHAKAKHGATSPLTLMTQSNLASALSNDQQYASAEPLLREMLVHQRRVCGKEDINTLITVSTVAATRDTREYLCCYRSWCTL